MKKSILTVAIASIALVGCAEQASAEVTVYGSMEQVLKMVDDGTTKSKNIEKGDAYVGFKTSEDLGNGVTAIVDLSLDVDTEASSGAATSVRDTYVGLSSNAGTVTLGRQKNLTKRVGGVVDIFEGPSATVAGQTRSNDSVMLTTPNMGGLTGAAMFTADGSTGDDNTDTNEFSVAYANGPITLGVSRLDDDNNDDQTMTFAGSYNLGSITVAAASSEVDNNDGTANVDTMTYAGSMTIGNNVLKAGFQDADEANETTTFEAVHKLSSKTSAYVNFQNADPKDGSAETDTTSIGLRVKF